MSYDGINLTGGGMDTTRVHNAATDRAYRAHQRATARRNLAAAICRRHGVDPATDNWTNVAARAAAVEFAELCAALGLGATERKPGHCDCGAVLPMAASMSYSPQGDYVRGMCLTCSREAT